MQIRCLRLLGPFLTIVMIFGAGVASAGPLAASQGSTGCEGQWLVHLSFEGRDAVEEAIAVFAAGGGLVLHGSPVVPALPGSDDGPLHVSDTVGGWAPGSGVHCTFDVVRLLAAEDGVALGAVSLRGGIVVDDGGLGLTGTFTYDQSAGLGQTVSSGSGTLVGTSISS